MSLQTPVAQRFCWRAHERPGGMACEYHSTTDYSTDDAGPMGRTTCFIGSFLDGPGQGVIVLRGDLGATVVGWLGCHIDDFLAGPTRFLMIDARAVDSYHGDLLDLLGRTQHRLGVRCGMLQVRGLRPAQLTDPPPPDAVTAPVDAGAATGAVPGVDSGATTAAAV